MGRDCLYPSNQDTFSQDVHCGCFACWETNLYRPQLQSRKNPFQHASGRCLRDRPLRSTWDCNPLVHTGNRPDPRTICDSNSPVSYPYLREMKTLRATSRRGKDLGQKGKYLSRYLPATRMDTY